MGQSRCATMFAEGKDMISHLFHVAYWNMLGDKWRASSTVLSVNIGSPEMLTDESWHLS